MLNWWKILYHWFKELGSNCYGKGIKKMLSVCDLLNKYNGDFWDLYFFDEKYIENDIWDNI